MPKISIIVPVYNAEKFLHKCIESILMQTFSDFELLLINDGSIDSSSIICDNYAKTDSRIIVFHKENGGVSSARNLGLNNAKGEWIAYIDADDWIEPTMLEELYNKALSQDADLVYCDFMMNYNDRRESYRAADYSSNKEEMLKNYITSVWTCLANLLVKKDIYITHNLSSPSHLCYCEDFWLSVRLFYYARKIAYVSKPFYNYYRGNSESRVNNLDRRTEHDEQQAYLETADFFQTNGDAIKYEREMSWRILKSKQELVLDRSRHDEFLKIYPTSHKHIWTCPYINRKLKIMMWMLSNNRRCLLNLIIKARKLLRR